jgi:dephospho-CoA kinase
MTAAKFSAILARQMPDSEKRRRAHYVIDTDKSLSDCAAEVAGLVRAIAGLSGKGIHYARNRRRY